MKTKMLKVCSEDPVNVRVGNLDVTDLLKNHLAYPTSVNTNRQYSEVIILKKNRIKRKIQNEIQFHAAKI